MEGKGYYWAIQMAVGGNGGLLQPYVDARRIVYQSKGNAMIHNLDGSEYQVRPTDWLVLMKDGRLLVLDTDGFESVV